MGPLLPTLGGHVGDGLLVHPLTSVPLLRAEGFLTS